MTLTATATDNVGVAGVQFLVDNNALGAEDTTSPYSVTWNTTTVANGTHTLTARARDAAGNTATSAPVTITVANVAAAPPAFVQVKAAMPQTNQSSVAVTYTGAQTAGNTNILAIGWNNATSNITSVTDSAGNTYQLAVPTARGNGVSQAIYYATQHQGRRGRNQHRDRHLQHGHALCGYPGPGVQRPGSGQSVRRRHLGVGHRHHRPTAARSPPPRPTR